MSDDTQPDKPRRGSSLDEILKEEGVFEELQAAAIKNVIAFQHEAPANGRHRKEPKAETT